MLDADVLKDGLDDHVGLLEASVVQLPRQVGQRGVPLKRGDAPLLGLVVEP